MKATSDPATHGLEAPGWDDLGVTAGGLVATKSPARTINIKKILTTCRRYIHYTRVGFYPTRIQGS